MSAAPTRRTIPIVAASRASSASAPGAEAGVPQFRHALPLSLYVHVPWCVRKCPYCDFNSHAAEGPIPEDEYVSALIADLESALPLVWGRPVVSVFIGGGTPSLLSGAAVDRLLGALRARLPLSPGAEITLEANPGTAEADKFAAFRAAGVTRLSLGIQSFDSKHLRTLGRIHDGDEARRAAALAAAHFDNFNLDLMYGLPGQTPEESLADIEQALAFSPTHLSCYQLTVEPHTAYAAAPPPGLPDGDRCADMQDALEQRLAAAGFTHYETSAFAQPDRQCRHNLNYWGFGDYLGIGAGAHGKLTWYADGRWQIHRQMRWKLPRQYLAEAAAGRPVQDEFEVAPDELAFEFMMNALRLNQGFDAALFEARTGLSLHAVETTLAAAERDGLLERPPGRIVPTRLGRRFLNRLLERFLPTA